MPSSAHPPATAASSPACPACPPPATANGCKGKGDGGKGKGKGKGSGSGSGSHWGATASGASDVRATLLERYIQTVETEGPLRHMLESVLGSGIESMGARPFGDAPPGAGGGGGAADVCAHCGQGNLTAMLQEGYVYCRHCHTVDYILVDHDKPSYRDPPKETVYFAYKRINHFNEWLDQVQGKETTDIPDEVYDSILLEIKKQKLTNMAKLTKKRVKEILKKLKFNKYYEHCPHIITRINGMPSLYLPTELEDRLRHMFCQIQVPFYKHSPPKRRNFLSYSYVLHKFMQLLDKDQYLDSFQLLKSREKLHQQDQIWQKICAEISWDFIPSL